MVDFPARSLGRASKLRGWQSWSHLQLPGLEGASWKSLTPSTQVDHLGLINWRSHYGSKKLIWSTTMWSWTPYPKKELLLGLQFASTVKLQRTCFWQFGDSRASNSEPASWHSVYQATKREASVWVPKTMMPGMCASSTYWVLPGAGSIWVETRWKSTQGMSGWWVCGSLRCGRVESGDLKAVSTRGTFHCAVVKDGEGMDASQVPALKPWRCPPSKVDIAATTTEAK